MSGVIQAGAMPSVDYEKKPLSVEVKDVSMVFNMASESLGSFKEYFIKLAKHELFFEEFRALKHISFEVHQGEVVGLVGTNGSGKSTMLKIIAGVLEPSEGEVRVHGNIAPLIELGAGFDPELTARENIYLNGSLLGYTKEFIDANFDGIIDFAELNDFVDMPLKNFSSGMVARIAFAIATITEPDILIVDETLSVGDVPITLSSIGISRRSRPTLASGGLRKYADLPGKEHAERHANRNENYEDVVNQTEPTRQADTTQFPATLAACCCRWAESWASTATTISRWHSGTPTMARCTTTRRGRTRRRLSRLSTSLSPFRTRCCPTRTARSTCRRRDLFRPRPQDYWRGRAAH